MTFTTELWRAARKNLLIMDSGKQRWCSVKSLRMLFRRGKLNPTALLRIVRHKGHWTVGEILGPCPPGPTERKVHPPGSMDSFASAVSALLLAGHHGKAICWDRFNHWEIRDEDDYIPPGLRQILTGDHLGILLANIMPNDGVMKELSTRIHSLYDAAGPDSPASVPEKGSHGAITP